MSYLAQMWPGTVICRNIQFLEIPYTCKVLLEKGIKKFATKRETDLLSWLLRGEHLYKGEKTKKYRAGKRSHFCHKDNIAARFNSFTRKW